MFKKLLATIKYRIKRTPWLIKRLRILSAMQLSEKFKKNRNATKAQKVGMVAKTIVPMVISYGVFTLLFYLIFKVLFVRAEAGLFIFTLMILQLISIISCIISMSQNLYTSKDNMLLLTYPVRHIQVFFSKLIVNYVIELRKSLILTFPMFMAYATINTGCLGANYIISAVCYSILLPLFPVLIGSLLSIPFVYLTKIFKKAGWVKGIFSLAVFAGLIVLTVFFIQWLDTIKPIRIVALWNTFLDNLSEFLNNANKFALYCNFVGNGMLETGNIPAWGNHLIMLGILIGLIVLTLLIAWPLFYKLASASGENASEKTHKGKNKAHKNLFMTFFRKEITLSLRNIGNFASDYIFLFLMPFVIICLCAIFTRIDRSDLGVSFTYGFIGFATLIMLAASNTASATAISSEGNEFVLLKTAPGKTSNIIWSKLLINTIIAVGMTLLTWIIMCIVLRGDFQPVIDSKTGQVISKAPLDAGILWIVFGFVVMVELGLLLWAIQIDILNPKLREFASSENKAELKNSQTSVLIGMVFSALFAAILIIIILTFISNALLVMVILFAIGLAFIGLRLYFLIQYRNAYFEDIQL